MSLKINGSTSGSVTLDAPATGSDVSLTLPTLGFGKVLQVVYGSTSTSVDSSTTTYIDTGLSATITPSSTSSKVLVIVSQAGIFKGTGSAANGLSLKLLRASTDLILIGTYIGYNNANVEVYSAPAAAVYLDSPATTSATTYKTQFMSSNNTSFVRVQQNAAVSTIVLVEVGP